jgi:predicted ArsR family transcriptional regulator
VVDRWDAIATLVDAGRRALYAHVQQAGHPVSREEAADALGISRGLAAFHLDKLVGAGLLRTRYEAPAGLPRGRGRTPKVYEAAPGEVAVSMPARQYALAAQIMADAIADDPTSAATAVQRHARRHGREVGARLRSMGTDLTGALAGLGFHPQHAADRIRLTNCPFDALATAQTELICGLNLAFINGLVDTIDAPVDAAADATGRRARLAPAAGHCCVEITEATAGRYW